MRISDWSSDVCSCDLGARAPVPQRRGLDPAAARDRRHGRLSQGDRAQQQRRLGARGQGGTQPAPRSEEHTSELQSLMRISYAVFCLKKINCIILVAVPVCIIISIRNVSVAL